MACKNCARLRRKLSPLEDSDFTEVYLKHEPSEWLRKQVVTRRRVEYIQVTLPDLYKRAFGKDAASVHDLTVLGRTLDALGWERTKYDGMLYFRTPVEEYEGGVYE